jgi:hypothetical protein
VWLKRRARSCDRITLPLAQLPGKVRKVRERNPGSSWWPPLTTMPPKETLVRVHPNRRLVVTHCARLPASHQTGEYLGSIFQEAVA